MSYLDSCFDANLDKSEAKIGNVTTGVHTGDVIGGEVQSKYMIEGILLTLLGRLDEMGFAVADPNVFAVRWNCPTMNRQESATLNTKTGHYRTTAKDGFGRQGLFLAGLGVAIANSTPFRTAWTSLFGDLELKGVEACSDENYAMIATEVVRALRTFDPQKQNGAGWIHSEEASIDLVEVHDIRNHLVSVEDFANLCDTFTPLTDDGRVSRFQGPQLRALVNMVKRRKHTALLGPPGVGKTVSAFEALSVLGFEHAGTDYQLFTGHDEVKSADFLGGWQPTSEPGRYEWVNGCLVRAMTAHGGKGQPLLVEEFTRMPTRAQNMFISALSDGYVVLNERPSANGTGEIVRAGPDFVMIADMNVDPAADDIDMYGAAFASRMRKLEYDYPTVSTLLAILTNEVPSSPAALRQGIATTYDSVMKRFVAQEITSTPISPRAAVQWLEDILAEDASRLQDSASMRTVAAETAAYTWLRDVAGTDKNLRKTVSQDVEAAFRKAFTATKP